MRQLGIVTVMTLLSGMALAGANYQDLDTNKDGVVSIDEAQNMPDLAKDFNAIDKNQDGLLDAAEFAQFEAAPATEQNADTEPTAAEQE